MLTPRRSFSSGTSRPGNHWARPSSSSKTGKSTWRDLIAITSRRPRLPPGRRQGRERDGRDPAGRCRHRAASWGLLCPCPPGAGTRTIALAPTARRWRSRRAVRSTLWDFVSGRRLDAPIGIRGSAARHRRACVQPRRQDPAGGERRRRVTALRGRDRSSSRRSCASVPGSWMPRSVPTASSWPWSAAIGDLITRERSETRLYDAVTRPPGRSGSLP